MTQSKCYLKNINSYTAGKSSEDSDYFKLSSNENALGTSPKAVKAYYSCKDNLFRYPDSNACRLKDSIAKYYNISADQLICGAGSDEIISLVNYAFAGVGDEVLYSQYGFLMYRISAMRAGATPIYAKEENLKTSVVNIVKSITDKTKIIFIANPNNPTGSYLNKSEIDMLLMSIPSNIVVVLDLAYAEFVRNSDYPIILDLVNDYSNLLMLRTFSKIYGLSSLRIGWGYSSLEIIDILNKIKPPFNVSNPAQISAISALEDEDFLINSINHNNYWKNFLESGLDNIGIKYYPSVANFILLDFSSSQKTAMVNKVLYKNKIIVREMIEYNLPNCLRVTIGNETENKKLLNILSSIFLK